MIVVRLVESDVVLCIDDEITGINIVTLKNHFKDFGLMHCSFLHEVNNFILDYDCMINVVIKLNLYFVLKLTLLAHEVLFLNWICEVFIIFGKKVEFTDVSP